jgi:helicase
MTHGPSEEDVDALLTRLEVGIPTAALGLLSLPIPLSRGEYLALAGNGVTNVTNLWALPAERLRSMLGAVRSEELESHRPR